MEKDSIILGKDSLEWRIHTIGLLNEIADCGLPKTMGALKVPLNIFKDLLAGVAQRATEINDPELNILMLRLTLYEVDNKDIPDAIDQQRKLIKRT